MNNIHIVDGRIGAKGAEVLQTKGGKPFVRFSLANNMFVGGQEKTVWYDVTSYDPFIIENKVDKLKKGSWVQVVGTLDADSKVKDNKVWINLNLTATKIDFVSSGSSESAPQTQEAKSQPSVSVYTGATDNVSTTMPVQEKKEDNISTGVFSSGGDDELPF